MTGGPSRHRSALPISALVHSANRELPASPPRPISSNTTASHPAFTPPSLNILLPLSALTFDTLGSVATDTPVPGAAGPPTPGSISACSRASHSVADAPRGSSSSTPATSPTRVNQRGPLRPSARPPGLRRLKPRLADPAAHASHERILKGPWKPAETALLADLVAQYGACQWSHIASHIPGRTGKQARERWKNHLDPALKKGDWTVAEDEVIRSMYNQVGKKWSTIARRLPGRSDNDVKNRFNGALAVRKERPTTSRTRAESIQRERKRAEAVVTSPGRRGPLSDPDEQRPSIFNMFF